MVYNIVPAKHSDLPAIYKLWVDSFGDFDVLKVLYPNGLSAITEEHEIHRLGEELTTKCDGPNPTAWHLVLFDDAAPEKLLSYANYVIGQPPSAGQGDPIDNFTVAAGANKEALASVSAYSKARRDELMKDHPTYLLLATMMTAAEGRGRGAASALLEWGKEKARELRLPCYLQASPLGAPLYRKRGWHDLGPHVTDLRPWKGGQEGIADFQNHCAMLWEPETTS